LFDSFFNHYFLFAELTRHETKTNKMIQLIFYLFFRGGSHSIVNDEPCNFCGRASANLPVLVRYVLASAWNISWSRACGLRGVRLREPLDEISSSPGACMPAAIALK
jgi:hypothetical protein